MNYDNLTNFTYTNVTTDLNQGEIFIFGYNGNKLITNFDTTQDYERVIMNAYTSFKEDISFMLCGFNNATYLISSTKVDFLTFKAHNTLVIDTISNDSDDIMQVSMANYFINGATGVNGGYYLGYSNGHVNPTNLYGNYHAYLEADESTTYDYTNLKYNIYVEDYRQEWPIQLVRGINQPFYTFALLTDASDFIDIGIGNTISNTYTQGFNNGYGNGYIAGRTDYSGSGSTTPQVSTAFDYISNAFEVVNNVMSVEVLPHITLWTCFSIPLVIILIMTIFKLVKK